MFLCELLKKKTDDFQKYESGIWKPESYFRKMGNAKPEMNSRNTNAVFWKAELNEISTAVK